MILNSDSCIFGIDFGMTHSCISYLKDGIPIICKSLEGETKTPSVVGLYPEEDAPVVGRTAKDMAVIYPEYTLQFINSKIGRVKSIEYGSDDDRRTITPVEVSAEIIKKLVNDASAYTNTTVNNVVITVPAYFSNIEKEEIREAGAKAGLNVIAVVNEPIAAALHYGCDKFSEDEVVCVFDLGGGTFDVTAMKMEEGVMTILAVDGNQDLGGKNWDAEMLSLVEEKFREQTGYQEEFDAEILQELQLKCETAKKQLTNTNTASVALAVDRKNRAQITITRDEFDARTSYLLATAIDITRTVFDRIEEYGMKIDKILLVGGSSYMTQVSDALKNEFNITPLLSEPELAICKGACNYEGNELFFSFDTYIGWKPKKKIKLKDLEPSSDIKNQLYGIQKALSELGYPTLAELISCELNVDVDLSVITTETIIGSLKDVKKRWLKISSSNREKYFKKIKIERICCGMINFFKKYMTTDYITYLKWMKIRAILLDMSRWMNSLEINYIDEGQYNVIVNSINSIVENKKDAKSILDSYCKDNKIAIKFGDDVIIGNCFGVSFEVILKEHRGIDLKLKQDGHEKEMFIGLPDDVVKIDIISVTSTQLTFQVMTSNNISLEIKMMNII